jgi:hypothetical protein
MSAFATPRRSITMKLSAKDKESMALADRGARTRVAIAAGVVLLWGALLLFFLASVQRMPVALAMLLTIITIGVPTMASRLCPGLLRRWWMWPILLLLVLDLAFTWQTVFVYDERTSPATRAKEADTRRRAAALE